MVSGYKVNETKSEAMMLVGKWLVQLDKEVSFNWSARGFRYLGIIITPETSQLYKANYDRLLAQIKSDLVRWEILPLSLFGRIETVRMNLLPRLLSIITYLDTSISLQIARKVDFHIYMAEKETEN